MDVTLTLFKKKADRGADIFAGTFAGPGTHPGEWQVLVRTRKLKDAAVKFLLIEFEEPQALPKGYAEKVDRDLYIDLCVNGDIANSISYPREAPLKAPQITKWILDQLKNYAKQPVPRAVEVAKAPVTIVEEPAELPLAIPEDREVGEVVSEEPFVSSWKLPVTITAAGLFVVGCAVVTGFALKSRHRFKDDMPVMFVDNHDREIKDFENINWDHQVHGDGSVVGVLPASQTSLEEAEL